MKFRILENQQSQGGVPQKFRPLTATEEYNALPWYGQAAQAADDTMRFLANGMTLGYADKIAGYLGGEGTEAERMKTARARERAGVAGDVAEVVGMYAPTSAIAKSALSATRLVPETLKGAKGLLARSLAMGSDGAAIGAVQATGNDTDPVTGALIGFGSGVGGNVLGEGITSGTSKILGALNKKSPTMTPEELKAVGSAAYARAKDAGVVFKPEAVERLRDTVYKDMAEFGFHPKNQPGAGVAYDELSRLSQNGNVGLDGLESLRRMVSGGFNPTNPSNNALLGKITDRIDDFAASAGANDVLTGNAKAATEALAEGRDYWSRFRKLEKVQELIDKAGRRAGSTGSGGNVENATRQELRKILDNKKLMRGFTKDELAAIDAAVMGTGAQNTLRLLGKLSPGGNGLMMALGGATTALNPYIGIPAMALGYGAKKAAESMTARNAETVKKLIAAGGSKSALEGPKNTLQRLTESKRDASVRARVASGLVAAGQQ
jgi:hypothetical protein